MNKKGFTLVEIAIVVAIIALLAVAVIPRVSDLFGSSIETTMKIQENNVRDAAMVYLEDYCNNPLPGFRCRLTRNNDYTYNGTITLDNLVTEGLIDPVSIQGVACTGTITFDSSEASVSLDCGDVYRTFDATSSVSGEL